MFERQEKNKNKNPQMSK